MPTQTAPAAPATTTTECGGCPRAYDHDADLDHTHCPSCDTVNTTARR